MKHEQSSPALVATPTRPSHAEVAKLAYLIYLNHGRPDGHAVTHWLEAESQMTGVASPLQQTLGGQT